MKVSVFGCGYVGLVTAACLADTGHDVYCCDIDENKVSRLRDGIIPIYEAGLEDIIKRALERQNLHFTTSGEETVHHGEVIFIAVGTPSGSDGNADLTAVFAVAGTIGNHAEGRKVVVDKSTVPVGTARQVQQLIDDKLRDRNANTQVYVCSNPEFLKEGTAVADFTRGPRIIVGTDSDHVRDRMTECYRPYNRQQDKLMFMGIESAELTKYAANGMLATKISFINELSQVAEVVGADIEDVRKGIGSDPRIGYSFIYAGCGFGGSCFPKDLRALSHTAHQHNVTSQIIDTVQDVNERQKQLLFKKLVSALRHSVAGMRIAIWGIAFKPETDDIRDAPSLVLMSSLLQANAEVIAYDPVASAMFQQHSPHAAHVNIASSASEALQNADALVICTEWKEFRGFDLQAIRQGMRGNVIIDGRNVLDPKSCGDAGFEYHSIGRARILPTESQRTGFSEAAMPS